jgi:hypothetical protein
MAYIYCKSGHRLFSVRYEMNLCTQCGLCPVCQVSAINCYCRISIRYSYSYGNKLQWYSLLLRNSYLNVKQQPSQANVSCVIFHKTHQKTHSVQLCHFANVVNMTEAKPIKAERSDTRYFSVKTVYPEQHSCNNRQDVR